MTISHDVQCFRCAHLTKGRSDCKAFPIKIPEAIWRNKHDHTQPYPGDHGITFAPKQVVREADQSKERRDAAE